MSIPDFYSLMEGKTAKSSNGSAPDFYSMMEKKPSRSGLEKTGRLGAQYAIGLGEVAALPYEMAVAPLASKDAQLVEYRKNIFDDIERLQEQKAMGQWDQQDSELYQNLVQQLQNPEEAMQHVKTADIGIGGLAEKAGDLLGYNIRPEGLEEHGARFVGNILSPKNIAKIPGAIKNLANKEFRQAIKLEKQWKNLERAAASSPENETMLNFAKSHGLSPEETNLLFHSKGNAKFLEATAKKSKKLKNTIKSLKGKLGENYEELKRLGREGGKLNYDESVALATDLEKLLDNMGRTFVEGPDTASARGVIEKAMQKIMNQEGTVEELINSRQGLKEGINWKNVDRGDAFLAQADKAFLDAIAKKNPMVYDRLLDTDKAYAKYKQFSGVLREKTPVLKFKGVSLPGEMTPILAYGLTYALSGIKGLVAKEAFQRLATEIAINPAFRNPIKKLQGAILKGSQKGQKQALLVIKKMMKDENPELYSEIKDLDVE